MWPSVCRFSEDLKEAMDLADGVSLSTEFCWFEVCVNSGMGDLKLGSSVLCVGLLYSYSKVYLNKSIHDIVRPDLV